MTRRIEDLQCGNLKILQDDNGYCFSSDSVLLANFFRAKKGDIVVEFCSGSGVISILGTAKTNAKHFYCFEYQESLAKMSQESVKLNGIKNITVFNCDLKDAQKMLNRTVVDVVVVNPPYFTEKSASQTEEINIATHETTTTLKDIVQSASKILKFGGKFYMIHTAKRFAEICHQLIQHNLQPKQAVFVKPNPSKEYSVVLIEAQKGAKVGIKMKEFLVYDKDGNPTEELQKIYNNKK